MIRSRQPLVAALSTALAAALIVLPTLSQAAAPAAPAAGSEVAVLPAGDGQVLGYDARRALRPLAPTGAQRAAATRLRDRLGAGLTVAWNRTLGTPRAVQVTGGTLTSARTGDPATIARDWLATNAGLLGLTAGDVAALAVVRNHELPGVRARVLSFVQTFGGVESGYGAILTVLVDRQGRVVSYTGNPVRSTGLAGRFDLTAAEALSSVVRNLAPGSDFTATATGDTQGGYQVFEGGPFGAVQHVRTVAFPMPGGARAAYAVLFVRSTEQAWAVLVDAESGRTLLRKSLVNHAEGTIYENYPGADKGGKPVVRSFDATPQSPGGWVDPSGAAGASGPTTLGNNADTIAQWSAPLAPSDQYHRPVSPTAEFNYDFPDSWAKTQGQTVPPSYADDADAAVVNLFYHHNRIHDEYYEYGFTETAGNFQSNNFGLGGEQGDPVLGQAQSGAVSGGDPTYLGRDNANFLTLPDGIPGASSMYLWEPIDDAFEGLYRDGDFDATIIQHEYSHGLSNRYVGGGGLGSLGSVQSGSMGEGWGDWFAMNHLFGKGFTRNAVTAPYVGSRERGIRNWNYARNPLTYGDFGYDVSGPEVHSDGEMWTAILWDLRTAILDEVGGDQARASDISEHLVMDAMPLSPPEPSFLDMRDAILKAAELRYGSTYTDELWTVFAHRGLGASASSKGETDTDPRPAFDHRSKSANGSLSLTLVNASAGGPVADARVFVGEFTARATPIGRTNGRGALRVPMTEGTYALSIQAGGYGIQQFEVRVRDGQASEQRIALRPNLVSAASGAKVVEVTSEDPGMPGTFLVDDSEASAWRTAPSDAPYNEGPKASVTVRLAKTSRIETVSVSAMKPPTTPRFQSAKQVTVETSMDGKHWKKAQVARFAYLQPRPTVSDMKLDFLRLERPVDARFVRATIDAVHGSTADTGSAAIVSELGVFGDVDGIRPRAPKPDRPVTEAGEIVAGNPEQGVLLLPGTEPYRDGATTASWKATCPDLPPANGADAWITALPSGSADGSHTITYQGDTAFGEFLLFYYDSQCQPITGDFGYFDQPAVVPPTAAYAGFLQLYGGATAFDVTVREVR